MALLFVPALACEIQNPACDPSEYEATTGTPAPAYSPVVGARTASPRAQKKPANDEDPFPGATASQPETADESAPLDPRPALHAFVAGGETRFLCPSGYRADPSGGSCNCVSAADGRTRYPLGDAPCGDGIPRAEGNECIFKCPAGE